MPSNIGQQYFTSTKKSMKNMMEENQFYIPTFQRDYQWKEENVEELFDDIFAAFVKQANYYFVGTLITHSNEGDKTYIIDGQQRLTTSSLLFGALFESCLTSNSLNNTKNKIHNCLIKYPDNDPADFTPVITSSNTEVNEELVNFFTSWSNEETSEISDGPIGTAFKYLKKKVQDEIVNNSENDITVENFCNYLQEKVFFTHTNTTSFAEAFTIFERENNRGTPLEFSDLLKNFLLGKLLDPDSLQGFTAERYQTESSNFNNRWYQIKTLIEKETKFDNFDQFLIYFLRFRYEHLFRQDSAMRELRKRDDISDPELFLTELNKTAKWSKLMTNGKNSDETINIPMMYINEFFGFDQHFQIFFGAELYDVDKYTRITTLMECLFFVGKWSGNFGSDLEKELIHFIKAIKDNGVDEDCCEHNCLSKIECKLRNFTDERLSTALHNLINTDYLNKMSTRGVPRHQKYIIFRTEQQHKYMASTPTRENSRDMIDGVDVDHILQKDDRSVWAKNLNIDLDELNPQKEQEIKSLVNRTGNLTLLGPVNNRVDFNGWTPSEKINGKQLYVCNTQHESGSTPVSVLPDDELCSICEEKLEPKTFSFENIDNNFWITKVLSMNPPNGNRKTDKVLRRFKFKKPDVNDGNPWGESQILDREKSQFHILSQALLTNIDPHMCGYEIDFQEINWSRLPSEW